MKKNIEAARKYKFADSELKHLADNVLLFIDRDAADFSAWGFTTARRMELSQAIDDFAALDSDETLDGIKIAATEDKNARRNELELQLRAIYLKAKFVFGDGIGKLREFGETYYSQLSDNDLVRTARTLEKAAIKYFAELETEGLTQLHLQNLAAAYTALDRALDVQTQAIAARDAATQTRIAAGNKLYELVSKYSEIGKEIYYTSNEAKYNDYVIYTTSDSTTPTADDKGEATEPPTEVKN